MIVQKDDYFGEIEFFSDIDRICSSKCRDYVDFYVIKKKDYLELAEDNYKASVNKYLNGLAFL